MRLAGRLVGNLLALSLLGLTSSAWCEPGDGPHSPVPRSVLEAPKTVWAAVRDPAYGGPMEAAAGPRLMRWNMWAQGHSRETLDWIREHPAESDWIYQHQKLAAWAKTFPEKAKLVDDHPDLLAYLEWNPAARQIQQGQPGLARIYELGEANHWGAPELSQGPGGDDGNPPPTMAEIRRSLMEEEGLTGEDLERALREAEGRLKAGTIRGPRPREDN